MKAIHILGCRLDPIDAGEAARRIVELARTAAGAQVVTLGTEMVVYAQSSERFRAIVNGSALSLCDTVGLLAVARKRGAPLRERVAGVELIEGLCREAAAQGLPIYFLGGAEGVAADAAAALSRRFPGLRVAGARNGYFSEAETPAVVAAIAASGARLLFAGLGSPRQEFWLADHLGETGCGAGIGVGGSFDVVAGRVARAPQSLRRLGLEWLYRLLKEPRRWRRQMALPRFVWLVALDELGILPARKSVVNS
ncbi:MAG TPA: WecB/TagA/CpsF family glycosyltransferase [Candidatus Baltobacteraceae bacterium]|nr:WecB/TagA/CpsF family glycosyltransferase [Candidatus Baltobacteraceae bacterium]